MTVRVRPPSPLSSFRLVIAFMQNETQRTRTASAAAAATIILPPLLLGLPPMEQMARIPNTPSRRRRRANEEGEDVLIVHYFPALDPILCPSSAAQLLLGDFSYRRRFRQTFQVASSPLI